MDEQNEWKVCKTRWTSKMWTTKSTKMQNEQKKKTKWKEWDQQMKLI